MIHNGISMFTPKKWNLPPQNGQLIRKKKTFQFNEKSNHRLCVESSKIVRFPWAGTRFYQNRVFENRHFVFGIDSKNMLRKSIPDTSYILTNLHQKKHIFGYKTVINYY